MRTRTCLRVILAFFIGSGIAASQLDPPSIDIPNDFKLDLETAGHLRPELFAQSVAATGPYTTARLVFDRLVAQTQATKPQWQLRIMENGQLNAYSSPDGTVFVESGLAQIAHPSSGLWAAILSHEIAHVVRRDWARRYLYQHSLENAGNAVIALGDPSLPSTDWMDSEKASQEMGRFCRRLELDADREGLMLMAKAGYHPDFVPALHHLLHAQIADVRPASLYSMHPCWEERDRELSRAYVEASIAFEHRWPESYASPGGNPPIVVFAEEPTIRKTAHNERELLIPMRCQNLAGAVEVVLHARPTKNADTLPEFSRSAGDSDLRQITGCTSPRTTISFNLGDVLSHQRPGAQWTDVYVIDAWGSVLARADLPKLPR